MSEKNVLMVVAATIFVFWVVVYRDERNINLERRQQWWKRIVGGEFYSKRDDHGEIKGER